MDSFIFDVRVTWGIKDGKKELFFPNKKNKSTKTENDSYPHNNKQPLQNIAFIKGAIIDIIC